MGLPRMASKRGPTTGLRAFDWADYVLYLLAIIGFALPFISIIQTGEFPSFLNLKKDVGILPSLSQQDQYAITAYIFLAFVVYVYIRNYIVMHRIDNRSDGWYHLLYFINYNNGWWYRVERIVRAAIILWVITSTIGVVPPVTYSIIVLIEFVVSQTVGFAHFQNLSAIEVFFSYYGFVIVVLFILFLIWDLINIVSIGNQVKAGRFASKVLGPINGCQAVAIARGYGFAIPESLQQAIPVYSLVAYIQPRTRTVGEMAGTESDEVLRSRVRDHVENGRILRLYFNGSGKFRERAGGFLIGLILLSTPWLSAELRVLQPLGIVAALVLYVPVMLRDVRDTGRNAFVYLFHYFFYAPPDWETLERCGDFQPSDDEGGDSAENGMAGRPA